MKPSTLAVLILVSSLAAEAQEALANKDDSIPESGTVCVLPNSATSPSRFSPGMQYNPASLKVQFDNSQPIPWPHHGSVKVEHLSLGERHHVVLTSDGKPLQSFWFRFSDYKDMKLCLRFDGYGGPDLQDSHNALWCRCK